MKKQKPPVTNTLLALDWICFVIWIVCIVIDYLSGNLGYLIFHAALAAAFLYSSIRTTIRYRREHQAAGNGAVQKKKE